MVNLMDVTPIKNPINDENYDNAVVCNKIGGGDGTNPK